MSFYSMIGMEYCTEFSYADTIGCLAMPLLAALVGITVVAIVVSLVKEFR